MFSGLKRIKNCDGEFTGFFRLIKINALELCWHRHYHLNKIGFYNLEKGIGDGLIYGVNLPVIGDFSVWRFSYRENPHPTQKR